MTPERCSVVGVLRQPTLMDFPGRVAVLMFIAGCNFRCGFCHNSALLAAAKPGFTWTRLAEMCDRYRANWVDGVVLSGGEPTLAADVVEIVTFLRERGFAVKLDTNGSTPQILRRLLPLLDSVAMDVKCAPESYPALTGFTAVAALRESVDVLRNAASNCELRTTVIGSFHTDAEMHGIGAMIRGAPRYVLQPFLPRPELPDPQWRTEPRTSPERLTALQQLMRPYAAEVLVRSS